MIKKTKKLLLVVLVVVLLLSAIILGIYYERHVKGIDKFVYPDGCVETYKQGELISDPCPKQEPGWKPLPNS